MGSSRRRMAGGGEEGSPNAPRKHAMFYRCAARTLVPAAKEELGHPLTVYVREDQLAGGLNDWIAGLCMPDAALQHQTDVPPSNRRRSAIEEGAV